MLLWPTECWTPKQRQTGMLMQQNVYSHKKLESRNKRCLTRQAGKLQRQEGAQAWGKNRNSGNEAARYTELKNNTQGKEHVNIYWQNTRRQQNSHVELVCTLLLWQRSRVQTRGFNGGSDEWVVTGVPHQPSPAEGEEQGGGENRQGKDTQTQNPHSDIKKSQVSTYLWFAEMSIANIYSGDWSEK